jgi:hypothetical protein
VTQTLIAWAAAAMMALSIAPVDPQRGPVDKGPGTLAAARKYLEGVWRLKSFVVTLPGREPITLPPNGTLTYDAYGNLTMDIQVDPKTAAFLDTVGIHTNKGSLYSSGKTAVNMQNHTLTYILKGQPPAGAPSGPLGLNRPRYWEVDGDVLTTITKDDSGQAVSTAKWQKSS